MANVHRQDAEEFVQVGEKTLPDTLLNSWIIWAEFMSVTSCKADVPISAGLCTLPLWSHTGILPTSFLPSLTKITICNGEQP